MNFHIGDKVVYPNHGVGIIEQISSRSIGTTVERFYLLNIKASSLKVMVPCHNAGSVGLRRVVRNGEIQKVLDLLSVAENQWQRRLERSLQRKFRSDADRVAAGSCRSLEEPDRPSSGQAAFFPREKDVGARSLSPGE